MKKVVLGIVLLNQLVNGMDLPGSSSSGQERQSNQLVSVGNTKETTVVQLPVSDLQDMIRDSVRESVSAVLGDQMINTQEFQVALNVVSLRLRDAFQGQMNMQAVNLQAVLDRKDEEHQREMDAKDAKLEEVCNEKIRLERENELLTQISRVFVINKSLKPEKIMIRSAEINRMADVFEKRAAVQQEYSKLELFSNLFGREDLGINAKQEDLTKVSEYLNDTKISQKPSEPTLIRETFLRKDFWFGRSYLVFPDEDFIRHKYEGAASISTLIGKLMTVDSYNRCKDIENTERRNAYNNAMTAWNAEVSRASLVPFPSDAFDCLVEQFNVFVGKL